MQPFSHLMQQWLYGKEGYYQNHKIGKDGDFYTSVSVSPFFGYCIANFIADFFTKLPPLQKIAIVEIGADKGYLISEYNGHMFPTKACDWEGKRLEHALRHARVVSDAAKSEGIAGTFGWCMFDYNTHRDFGSGDRICYHGVMDMFRNPKLAAAVYASQQEDTPVLEVSSSMDIGEHPAGALGTVAVFTNADRVDVYRNDLPAGSFSPAAEYDGLAHPPVLIDDTVSALLQSQEGMSRRTANLVRDVLLAVASCGSDLPLSVLAKAAYLMVCKGFSREELAAFFDYVDRFLRNMEEFV